MSDAKRGNFDMVIAEALDRLSRDQEDAASIYKHLSHADVRIVTLAEVKVNELHVGLGKPDAYEKALAALREDIPEGWETQLTWENDDYDRVPAACRGPLWGPRRASRGSCRGRHSSGPYAYQRAGRRRYQTFPDKTRDTWRPSWRVTMPAC